MKRNDTLKLKILQLISMVGEISADEIISFFEHAPYTKKQLSILKKDRLIRKYKGDDETTFRITAKEKKIWRVMYQRYIKKWFLVLSQLIC